MKRLLLASCLLTGLAAPAYAGFTGVQIGIDVGQVWADANQENFGNIGGPFIFTQADAEPAGWVYGVHGGYNMEVAPGLIIGGELAVAFNDMKGNDGGAGGDRNGLDGKYQAALRAKAGTMLSPTSMLYVTAGWQYLSAEGVVLNPPVEKIDTSFNGYTLGGGLEFTVGSGLTARMQYQFADYGDKRVSYPTNLYDINTGPQSHEVTLGLTYGFDLPGM
jgi:outer membrane immunogenic protein